MSASLLTPLAPRIAEGDGPAAGLKRFIVRLTEFDVWEIRIDAADEQTAEALARDHFTSSIIAKADFDHVIGDIDYVESEEVQQRGGQS
jgi:hypothetical protein